MNPKKDSITTVKMPTFRALQGYIQSVLKVLAADVDGMTFHDAKSTLLTSSCGRADSNCWLQPLSNCAKRIHETRRPEVEKCFLSLVFFCADSSSQCSLSISSGCTVWDLGLDVLFVYTVFKLGFGCS